MHESSRNLCWQGYRRVPPNCQPGLAPGFTLLELLVSLAVFTLALLLALELLLAAQTRLQIAAEQLLAPAGALAVEQLRADLRAASGIDAWSVGWSTGPLVLVGHPAGDVSYAVVDRQLIRWLAESASGKTGERLVLSQVTGWRWRWRGRSIEVDLRYQELGPFERRERAPVQPEIQRLLRVTPRAALSRQW